MQDLSHREKITKPVRDKLVEIKNQIDIYSNGHDADLSAQLEKLKAAKKLLKSAIVVLGEIESD